MTPRQRKRRLIRLGESGRGVATGCSPPLGGIRVQTPGLPDRGRRRHASSSLLRRDGVQLHFHQLSLFECMCESINLVIKGQHKARAGVNESAITPPSHQLAACCLSSYAPPHSEIVYAADFCSGFDDKDSEIDHGSASTSFVDVGGGGKVAASFATEA